MLSPLFLLLNVAVLLQTKKPLLTYEIGGSNVTLSLSADELNEVIDALETVNSESKLLKAWYEFLQRGVCLILQIPEVPIPSPGIR